MSIGALGGHYSVPLTPVISLFFLQRLEQLFSSWKIWDPRVLFSLAKCSKCLQCCWFHFLLPATISMIFLFLNHVLLFSFVLESTIFVSRSDLFMRVLLLLKWAFRYCACYQIFGVCFFSYRAVIGTPKKWSHSSVKTKGSCAEWLIGVPTVSFLYFHYIKIEFWSYAWET